MTESKHPDFDLFLVTKEPNEHTGKRIYNKVGAAWNMWDGEAISVKLNPGVVIDWRMMENFFLTLKEPYRPENRPDDDDVPF